MSEPTEPERKEMDANEVLIQELKDLTPVLRDLARTEHDLDPHFTHQLRAQLLSGDSETPDPAFLAALRERLMRAEEAPLRRRYLQVDQWGMKGIGVAMAAAIAALFVVFLLWPQLLVPLLAAAAVVLAILFRARFRL